MTTRDFDLTPRERQIIGYIIEGYTDGEIAKQIGLSLYTIREYVKTILQKLYLKNRVQVAIYAIRNLGY